MAHSHDIDSATAQFFINTRDNFFLDHQSNDPEIKWLYSFWEGIGGMEVVNSIEKTQQHQNMMNDVPFHLLFIENVKNSPRNQKNSK